MDFKYSIHSGISRLETTNSLQTERKPGEYIPTRGVFLWLFLLFAGAWSYLSLTRKVEVHTFFYFIKK